MTNRFEILPAKIKKNINLRPSKIYIIKGEVRVFKNVKLTIQDGVKILLVNGVFKDSCIKRSTLIFDQGSQLLAKKNPVERG